MHFSRITAAAGFAIAASLTLAACSNAEVNKTAASEPSASTAVTVDAKLADTVPESIRKAGVIRVATDPTYPPYESLDGDKVVGLDADLANAIGTVLGLRVEFVNTSFDAIIPALQSKDVDMAISSIGDNKTREQVVDFATTYWNGTLLLVKSGNPLGGTPDRVCGMRVGVTRGTLEQTDFMPAREAACKKEGENLPVTDAFQTNNQAVLALQSGRLDAVMGGVTTVRLIEKTSGGSLEAAGPVSRNPNPNGIAFPKGSEMVAPVSGAINVLMKNGVYADLLAKWDLKDIAIDKSVINGAQK